MNYDLVVIGAGPGGYTAAVRAAQLGAKVAVVERGEIGGVCLNRGCIPTKTMAYSAALLTTIRRASDFGIQTGAVAVDFRRLLERKENVVVRLAQGIRYLFRQNKIDLISGNASLVGARKVAVPASDGTKTILTARHVLVAVGTEPARPAAWGCDGESVLTSDEILAITAIPVSLLIIGGGVVGCEFACIFHALGSKVTILEALPTLLPGIDQETAKTMQGLLKRQGIAVRTNANITAIRKSAGAVTAVLADGTELEAERALVAVGRKINTDGLGLKEAGVLLGPQGEVPVDDTLQTNVPGIYAVGDVIGKFQLAHVASAQGTVAVENMFGLPRRMNYRVIPHCIFTNPEVAGVGLTGQEAQEKGIKIKVGKYFFIADAKAQVISETAGFVKILADPESDRVLGAHIVGPRATELIAEAVLAVRLGTTVKELAETVHAHPTLSESLWGAAQAAYEPGGRP